MRFQWSSSIPCDLSYSEYVKSKLYSTCRRSHALNCQVTPQNKVNIGAHVSRCEVYCGHLSTSYLNQYIPWDILMRFKSQWPSFWSRKVGLFVVVDLNVSPSAIHCLWNRYDEVDQFTRRVGQGRGCMTTPQDDWYLTICALRRRSATARELQQDFRRFTGFTVSGRE